ncbi:3-keto-5-aminohexanoate cleavage protein (plasmid) [Deinococcus sp. KNUC1210]|nr:3-keto-5-aminohexanoate cleavage protein [Deinococcus sp. KNUC1210]ULH14061.1 3-keto-5-aminohexanoate cleavage protein [Deinococcus sp. KNUC1210]
MFLQVCLNGSRTHADHPRLPVSASEMVESVIALEQAGVQSVHLHVHDASGAESLHPEAVAFTLQSIRHRCPTMELAVSTSESIVKDPRRRVDLLRQWTVWPDTLCTNLSEEGIDDVIALAQEQGVHCEAGLFWPEDIRHLRRLPQVKWRRLLLEPLSDDVAEAKDQLRALLDELGSPWLPVPHVIHGMNATTYSLLLEGAQRTRASRIGFEDTLVLPDGRVANDNVELYREALRWIETSTFQTLRE